MADFDSRNKFGFKHKILTAGLAAFMALSFVGCGNTPVQTTPPDEKDPPKPPIIVEDPPKKPTYTVEEAIADYTAIKTKFENANSLAVEFKSEDGTIYYEIQDGKFKVTDEDGTTIYETTKDGNFIYTLSGETWTKDLSEEENKAQEMLKSMKEYLGWITISSVDDNGKISGVIKIDNDNMNKANATITLDKTNNTMRFEYADQSITIYNLNNTTIKLPTEYTDNTQEKPGEEFKITAENYEAVKEAVMPHIENLKRKTAGSNAELLSVSNIYLTSSDENGVIDTIGAVIICNIDGGDNLQWVEYAIPTKEDLTYERIYKNELNYLYRETKGKILYTISANKQNETKYPTACHTLYSQTFGEDYKSADWYGWNILPGPGWDDHTIVVYRDDSILECKYSISNNGGLLNYEQSIERNFKNKEPSDTTYKIVKQTTHNLKDSQNRIFFEIAEDELQLQ